MSFNFYNNVARSFPVTAVVCSLHTVVAPSKRLDTRLERSSSLAVIISLFYSKYESNIGAVSGYYLA